MCVVVIVVSEKERLSSGVFFSARLDQCCCGCCCFSKDQMGVETVARLWRGLCIVYRSLGIDRIVYLVPCTAPEWCVVLQAEKRADEETLGRRGFSRFAVYSTGQDKNLGSPLNGC